MFILFIIFLVIAYLIGSVSSAVIVCKLMGLPDPREQGSGNPGTTNVLRIGGKVPAILTLVGDILKGFIPVFFAWLFGLANLALGLVAVAALVGHIFPVFFNFKGGKGIATAFGGILVLSFWSAIIGLIVWAIVLYIWRYSSLASLIGSVVIAISVLFLAGFSYFIPVAIMVCLLFWRHLDNIDRLRAGTESKIQF